MECTDIYKGYLDNLEIDSKNKRILLTIFEDKLERVYYKRKNGTKGRVRKKSDLWKEKLASFLASFYLRLIDSSSRKDWIKPYTKSTFNAFLIKKIQECVEIIPRYRDKRESDIKKILEKNVGSLDPENQRDIEILFMEWSNKPPERLSIFCSAFRLFEYSEYAQYLLKSNSKISITEVQHGAIQYWYKNSRVSAKIKDITKNIHYWDPENKESITRYGTYIKRGKRKGCVWIGRPIYDEYFIKSEPDVSEEENNLGMVLQEYRKAIIDSCCGFVEHPKGSPIEYRNSEFGWVRVGWVSSLEGKQMIFDTVNSSLIYMAIKRDYDYILAIDNVEKYRERMTAKGKTFIDYLVKEDRIVENGEALLSRIIYKKN